MSDVPRAPTIRRALSGAEQSAGWGLSACRGLRLGWCRLIELRQRIGAGRDSSHQVEREHAAALQLPALVQLQHHRSHQACDRGVVGEDAHHADAAFDLLVDALQQVGAPQLAPVADWEVAEAVTRGKHIMPLRHNQPKLSAFCIPENHSRPLQDRRFAPSPITWIK